MDNRAGEMQVFLRVVEAGNFSEAARLLRMTPSTVSKLIARIEMRLGVRLLERSTRRLSLTAEGRLYYERSQALLGELDEMEKELSEGAASAGGKWNWPRRETSSTPPCAARRDGATRRSNRRRRRGLSP